MAGEHEYFANGILVSNCDAFLYIWRYCYHHFHRKKQIEIQHGSPAYWAEKMREAADQAGAKKLRWQEMTWDERLVEGRSLDENLDLPLDEEWN